MAKLSNPNTFASEAHAYWNGNRPLWQAFWVYGMFFGTLLGTIMTPLSQFAIQFVMQDVSRGGWTPDNLLITYAILTLMGFWLTYYLWHFVAIWRCGNNSTAQWRTLSRTFITGVTITYWPLWLYVLVN